MPVAASDADWRIDKDSTGRFKSPNPAITKPHLKAGAQKNIVLGPAGCSHIGRMEPGTNLSAIVIIDLYTLDILQGLSELR